MNEFNFSKVAAFSLQIYENLKITKIQVFDQSCETASCAQLLSIATSVLCNQDVGSNVMQLQKKMHSQNIYRIWNEVRDWES